MNTAAKKLDGDRVAGRDLYPEDRGLGDAVDHRADHDAHRSTTTLVPETSLDDAITDEEDRSADQHPDSELEAIEVLRFSDEVEGDRFDQRARAEAGEYPDELRWKIDPVHQEPAQQQRGLRQRPERDRLQHRRCLLSDVRPSRPTLPHGLGPLERGLDVVPQRAGECRCRGDDPGEADDRRNRAQHADDLVNRRTGRECGVHARPVRRGGGVDGDEHAEPNQCLGPRIERASRPWFRLSHQGGLNGRLVIEGQRKQRALAFHGGVDSSQGSARRGSLSASITPDRTEVFIILKG